MKSFCLSIGFGILALTGGALPVRAVGEDTSAKEDLKAAGSNIAEAAKKIGTEIKDGTVDAALQIKTGAVWVAIQVKTGAVKVANGVKEKTSSLTDRPRTAQDLLDLARGQVTDHRYRDALVTMDKLNHFKLTPEQEKDATQLRAQINQAFHDSRSGSTNTPATSP